MQLSDICEEWDINLDHVHSFEYMKNEWAIALMQIYEKLYRSDCKAHGSFDQEGKPVPKENKDGKREPIGLSTPMRQLIMHFHDRRIRIAPPEDSVAYRRIEDLEFYVKRLGLVEDRVHLEYKPEPIETGIDANGGLAGKTMGLKATNRNASKNGTTDDVVEVDYIEGDKFGRKIVKSR